MDFDFKATSERSSFVTVAEAIGLMISFAGLIILLLTYIERNQKK